jgi:hypothetical protein
MYLIGLASISTVVVLVLPWLSLILNQIIVSLRHQAIWLIGLRQVSDIVQGLYHPVPKVVD